MDIVMEVRKELKLLADEKYRIFHSKLVPGKEHILGVRMPKLRQLAKRISAGEGWRTYLDGEPSEYYEEELLRGFIIGYARMPLEERLKRLKAFIPVIDNWAVCDVVSCAFKFKKKDSGIVFDFVKKYISNEAEFKKRFAVVMILAHFVDENHIDEILKMLNNINDERFYVSMARAWALSVCFVKFEEKTYDILKNGDIDKATLNRAISKINQSKRVSVSAKERVKKLRA